MSNKFFKTIIKKREALHVVLSLVRSGLMQRKDYSSRAKYIASKRATKLCNNSFYVLVLFFFPIFHIDISVHRFFMRN